MECIFIFLLISKKKTLIFSHTVRYHTYAVCLCLSSLIHSMRSQRQFLLRLK